MEDLADVSALANDLRQGRIEPEFTMQAVRNETGIPSDTLYAWERRYGFPAPGRTDTGQRRYSERDIIAIRWLREQTGQGHSISDALALLRRALNRDPEQATSLETRQATATALERFLDKLLAGNPSAAQAAWDEIAVSTSPDGLLDDVILPAWSMILHSNVSALARENGLFFLHRKTMVLLDRSAPESGDRDVAVLTNGPADTTIPAHALACALSRAGFRIALPILDASLASTLALVSRLPASTTVIVTGPETNGDELENYRVMNPDTRSFRWWPIESSNAKEDWLPPSLRKVTAALGDRA